MPPTLPSTAIIVYQDDRVMAVWEGLDQIRREYEAIDVENGSYRFYNYAGLPLIPSFIEPVEHGSFLGLLKTVGGGEYTLVPSAVTDATELRALVAEAAGLKENPWFASLYTLASYLRSVP